MTSMILAITCSVTLRRGGTDIHTDASVNVDSTDDHFLEAWAITNDDLRSPFEAIVSITVDGETHTGTLYYDPTSVFDNFELHIILAYDQGTQSLKVIMWLTYLGELVALNDDDDDDSAVVDQILCDDSACSGSVGAFVQELATNLWVATWTPTGEEWKGTVSLQGYLESDAVRFYGAESFTNVGKLADQILDDTGTINWEDISGD